MKKLVNGELVEMTEEEIKELTNFLPDEVKETIEDKVDKLERLLNKIATVLDIK